MRYQRDPWARRALRLPTGDDNDSEQRGMFPRVFGDEFGDKFGDEFGDKFSELPNLVIILVMNLVNCQIR